MFITKVVMDRYNFCWGFFLAMLIKKNISVAVSMLVHIEDRENLLAKIS